jgi:hypothetical protein
MAHASVQEHARPWCFVLIDTLHLTHCVRPGIVKWSDVQPFDRRLARVGCKLLFVRAAPTAIRERGIVPRKNEQFMQEYARKFGRTEEEIHRYFVSGQERLAGLFSHSAMPKLLAQNDGTVDEIADNAYRFWTEEEVESGSAENLRHREAASKRVEA